MTVEVAERPHFKTQSLEGYHSMGLKATASEFFLIHSKHQLAPLWREGWFDRRPVLLGEGTNTVFITDPKRPVCKIAMKGIRISDESESSVLVQAAAGENWHQLVTWAVAQNYGGIENLALIPGTVGAAPVQNIGAYGVELSDVFEELEAFSMKHGTFKTIGREECRFGYRSSLFKHGEPEWLICSVSIRLTKDHHKLSSSYQSLETYLEKLGIQTPGIGDLYQAVCSIRKSKLPDPKILPNCGSFFKNPVISMERFRHCKSMFPDMPAYPAGDSTAKGHVKIPAGWLIEKAGWKGRRKGGFGMYRQHALVLVHFGGSGGGELHAFMEEVTGAVLNLFGIQLEPEVHLIGDTIIPSTQT
ncbi:MAG: UDP-N-acetylenolpyruvoylglucosamine reductase [Bacteroidetes bacterium]|jgi:UDP-N-acetylmuramate dehydrogenase|nr:UDP-N-acetylmuramate dehydrogenase [Bacteroidota bacterium]PTM16514.1 MAG: UDP-N-acetylenolpyruvoylglucosamine reductase [Bacteroidota bacterium]